MEKNKIMLIIIIILLVVLLATIGVISVYAINVLKTNGNAEISQNLEEETDRRSQLSVSDITNIEMAKAISTTLLRSEDGSDHVISVNIKVGVDKTDKKNSQKIIDEVTANINTVIRSTCITIIKKKTYEEVTEPDGSEKLIDEILVKLQEQFQSNLIVDVGITDWYTE